MIYRGFEQMLRSSMEYHYKVKSEDIAESAKMRLELLEHIKNNEPEKAADCVSIIIQQGISVLKGKYSGRI